MMRRTMIACALLACVATHAFAAGINLSWNACGAAGATNRTFACNTNSGGVHVLVGSFVAPAGTTAITGEEIVITLASTTDPLPAWWMFKNAGTCRQNAFSINADFTAGVAGCDDYWAGQAIGGITLFNPNVIPGYGGRAQVHAMYTMSASITHPAEENIEYGAFRLAFNNTKTVGTGACGGCTTPMCIQLYRITLQQPTGLGNFDLYAPLHSNIVTWQGGDLATVCYTATPARNRTWGGVKSLYH